GGSLLIGRVGELGGTTPRVPPSTPARAATIDAAIAPVTWAGVIPSVTAAAAAVALPSATTVFVLGLAEPTTAPGNVLHPLLAAPDPGWWGDRADEALRGGEAADANPTAVPAPAGDPTVTLSELGARAWDRLRLRQQACDACFADGSWLADRGDMTAPLSG